MTKNSMPNIQKAGFGWVIQIFPAKSGWISLTLNTNLYKWCYREEGESISSFLFSCIFVSRSSWAFSWFSLFISRNLVRRRNKPRNTRKSTKMDGNRWKFFYLYLKQLCVFKYFKCIKGSDSIKIRVLSVSFRGNLSLKKKKSTTERHGRTRKKILVSL